METNRLHLYLANRKSLVDRAARIVGDPARAEDVVQDAWLRFSSAPERDGESNRILEPLAYLRRIVSNLAIDHSRRQLVENVHPDGDADLVEMASEEPSQERMTMARDELDHVTRALAELPPRTRQAFDLYRFQGKTLSEVGLALGISQTRAHQLVQEAMIRCAAGLIDEEDT